MTLAETGPQSFARKPEQRTPEWIWVRCPCPVIARGLRDILETEARVYCGEDPLQERTFRCLVLYCREEELAGRIRDHREHSPEVPVLVVGQPGDVSLARAAIQSGTRGFIHVGMQANHIRRALVAAVNGELVVPREMIGALVGREEPVDPLILTPRKREVLGLVAEGKTNAQIADELYLSEYTVKQHLRSAFKLLDVRNRVEAARLFKRFYES